MEPTAEQSTSPEKTVCELFDAYIFRQEFLNDPYKKVLDLKGSYGISVWNLLNDSSSKTFSGANDIPPEWIWINLPAVNKKWILELVRRMKENNAIHNAISLPQIEEFIEKSFTNASGIRVAPQFNQRAADIKAQRLKQTSQDATLGEAGSDQGLKETAAPVGGESTSIKPDTQDDDAKDMSSSLDAKSKEPATKGQIASQKSIQEQFSGTEMFALALPYLDSQSGLVKSTRVEQLRQHYGAFEGRPTRILDNSEDRLADVIFSRTLDQCFFSSTHVTVNLDSDQVVYNYLNELAEKWRNIQKKKKDETQNDPTPLTLLTPEQEIELMRNKMDEGKRLITSPLRLWKIGHVVISAFPDQEHEMLNHSEIQGLICRSIWESCPISAMDLVLDLVHIFVDFVDRPFNSGLSLSPLWIFERVIAEEAEKQVIRYKEFEKIMKQKHKDKSERNDNTSEANLLVTPPVVQMPAGQDRLAEEGDHVLETEKQKDSMSLITEEAESFKNVMDIRDELGMIDSVVKEQEVAMTQFSNYLDIRGKPAKGSEVTPPASESRGSGQSKAAGESGPDLQNLNQRMGDIVKRVQRRQSRIAGLDKRTSMIEKGLNHLLDIKLKRSSLEEAADTNEVAKLSKDIEGRTHSVLQATNSVVTNTHDLARKSDERAKQSDKQSALIFAFTVVTIWFTPLSFVTGFFAIPSKDFPQDSTQEDVDWKQWQIGVGLFVAFLLTLLFSASVWAWYKRQDRDRKAKQGAPKIENQRDGNDNGQVPDEKAKKEPTGQASASYLLNETPTKPTPPSQPPSPDQTPQKQRRSWDWLLRSREAARDSLAHGRGEGVVVSSDAMV
ncbi:hypothetical protein F4680DRAFT_429851 [Xylaria scruposa]|nr:hypothetical protein F4680DRAFT_429851 [Xylaria scruposa]